MPSLKIYPPSRLPDNGVTETQFNMWKEELEVYLSQEPDFKVFLPKKLYNTWLSAEEHPDRIAELKAGRVEVNEDAAGTRVNYVLSLCNPKGFLNEMSVRPLIGQKSPTLSSH